MKAGRSGPSRRSPKQRSPTSIPHPNLRSSSATALRRRHIHLSILAYQNASCDTSHSHTKRSRASHIPKRFHSTETPSANFNPFTSIPDVSENEASAQLHDFTNTPLPNVDQLKDKSSKTNFRNSTNKFQIPDPEALQRVLHPTAATGTSALENIEQFKKRFLSETENKLHNDSRQNAFSTTTKSSTLETPEPVLPHNVAVQPLHDLLQGQQPLSRRQFRALNEMGTNSEAIQELMQKIPPQFTVCRGCGIGLQCDESEKPGFIPSANLQSYLLRLDLQLRAAKQDLRIRSGGGKGQGTAIAALHAALRSSLAHIQRDNDARLGKVGRFKEKELYAMGLDLQMRPLPRPVQYDPETGLPLKIDEPENNPQIASIEHVQIQRTATEKKLQSLLDNPNADIDEINNLQKELQGQRDFINLEEESNKINQETILNKHDVQMLEKAAKLAAKPAKCQRCHRLGAKQFGEVSNNVQQSIPAEEFIRLLRSEFQHPDAKSSIIVKVVDVLDFHGSMIQDIQKLTGPRNPVIIAVNKCDMLPRSVSPLQIQQWAESECQKYGLTPHSIFPISANTGAGVEDLITKALFLARGANDPTAPRNRKIYVMGTTNVGKSTLINQLLKKSVIGTGMPNDVTSLAEEQKQRRKKQNNKNKTGGDGNDDDDDESLPFLDTQAVDEEMELQIIDAKRAERGGQINTNDVTITDVLQMNKTERGQAHINSVVADVDVAGVNRAALDAVMPNEYLLQHQRELQIAEASATTSPLPGTTLGIVSFPVLEKKRGGKNLQIKDTPGVLNSWQLSSHLQYDELKRVLPTKHLTPLTYRVRPGQTIFLGGLARIDMIAGKPFHVTSFVSNAVSVHIAASHRADKNYLEQQIGVNLIPPFDPHDTSENNRVKALSIYQNLANVNDEESARLEELQEAAREEHNESMDRATSKLQQLKVHTQRKNINNNVDEDEDIPENDELFSKMQKFDNMPDPKRGIDTLTHLRENLRSKISDALGSLAPVATHTETSCPSRVFIDEHGRFVVQLVGDGFNVASHDIVIAGLGWISVTGSGPCTFRIGIAGEPAKLSPSELQTIATYAHVQQENDTIGHAQAISPLDCGDDDDSDGDDGNNETKNKSGTKFASPRLSKRVKRLLSRISIRNPLVIDQGRRGTKWTGVPELVKKRFNPEMHQQRQELMQRNELLTLHRKNPTLHPHPDEIAQKKAMEQPFSNVLHYRIDSEQERGFSQNPLVAKILGHRDDQDIPISPPKTVLAQEQRYHLPNDTQSGSFDSIPHPKPIHYTAEEMIAFDEKLEHKMAAKQALNDWEHITAYHQDKAKSRATRIGDEELISQLEAEELQRQKNLSSLAQDLRKQPSQRKPPTIISDGENEPIWKHADIVRQEATQAGFQHNNDEKWGDDDDDDSEFVTDVNRLYDDMTTTDDESRQTRDSFLIREEAEQIHNALQKSIRQQKKRNGSDDDDDDDDDDDSELYAVTDGAESLHEDGDFDEQALLQQHFASQEMHYFSQVDYDSFEKTPQGRRLQKQEQRKARQIAAIPEHDDENSSDFDAAVAQAVDGYSDVEYMQSPDAMPSLEELAAMSDYDGIDYNELRARGELDHYLAAQNLKIHKQPVPTGAHGKMEKGGRRARHAMGLMSQDKYEEIELIKKQKEAKILQSYLQKSRKAAQYDLNQSAPSRQAQERKRRENASNAETAQKQWVNDSVNHAANNRRKVERQARHYAKHGDQFAANNRQMSPIAPPQELVDFHKHKKARQSQSGGRGDSFKGGGSSRRGNDDDDVPVFVKNKREQRQKNHEQGQVFRDRGPKSY